MKTGEKINIITDDVMSVVHLRSGCDVLLLTF